MYLIFQAINFATCKYEIIKSCSWKSITISQENEEPLDAAGVFQNTEVQ